MSGDGFALTGAGAVGPPGAAGGSGPAMSAMVNGYFTCFSQGGIGAPATAVNTGTLADGWIYEGGTPGADTFERITGTILGANSEHKMDVTKGGAAGKIFLAQFWNTDDSLQQQGFVMSWAVKLRASDGLGGTETLRIGFLNNTNGNDTLPRGIVSAFNADGIDPTLAGGYSITGAISVTPAAASYLTFVLALSQPVVSDNMGIGIWTDRAVAAGADIGISETQMVPPGSAVVYPARAQDASYMAACQERQERTYERDTANGTITSDGAINAVGGTQPVYFRYRVAKRQDPIFPLGGNPQNGITFYSPITGLSGLWANITSGFDFMPLVNVSSNEGVSVTEITEGAGDELVGHIHANADL